MIRRVDHLQADRVGAGQVLGERRGGAAGVVVLAVVVQVPEVLLNVRRAVGVGRSAPVECGGGILVDGGDGRDDRRRRLVGDLRGEDVRRAQVGRELVAFVVVQVR